MRPIICKACKAGEPCSEMGTCADLTDAYDAGAREARWPCHLVYLIVTRRSDGTPSGAEKAWGGKFWLTPDEAEIARGYMMPADVRDAFMVAPFVISKAEVET